MDKIEKSCNEDTVDGVYNYEDDKWNKRLKTLMWNELTKVKQQYLKLDLQNALDYEKFCTISIVWHSTKIEGCSLTETDTKVLLEKDITAAGKPLRDHLMIKDHYTAFQFIKKQARQKEKITPEFIQQIGSLGMKHTGAITNTVLGTFDSSKGDLRLTQVYVDKKYFPDYKKVPELLNQLCQSVNERLEAVKKEDILKLASDLHYNFVNMHPFADGNGRTARLLMNYIQLYHDEPLIKIFSENRTEYIDALNETENKEDINIFREFIGKQQLKFLHAEIDKYTDLDKGYVLMF